MIVVSLPADDLEPHPELAASVRPSAADMLLAMGMLGWLPDEADRLRPAVPAGTFTVD